MRGFQGVEAGLQNTLFSFKGNTCYVFQVKCICKDDQAEVSGKQTYFSVKRDCNS